MRPISSAVLTDCGVVICPFSQQEHLRYTVNGFEALTWRTDSQQPDGSRKNGSLEETSIGRSLQKISGQYPIYR